MSSITLCSFFLQAKNHKNQLRLSRSSEEKYMLLIASYFSGPNNTKYLVPSYILITSSILSNLILKGFEPIKFLYEMP